MSDDRIDGGQDGMATRRLMQLALWLRHGAPAGGFTWVDVCQLQAWKDCSHKQFDEAFNKAREELTPFGLRVEYDPLHHIWRAKHNVSITPAERQALMMALTVADPGPTTIDEDVPLGLGIDSSGAEIVVGVGEQLTILLAAIRDRQPVEISHRGARRRLDPYGLGLRSGKWFIAGRDHQRDALRVFGLDRQAPKAKPPETVGPGSSFDVPADFEMNSALLASADPSRRSGMPPIKARLSVDADAMPVARSVFGNVEVHQRPPVPRETDGWQHDDLQPAVLLHVTAADVDTLIRHVLSLRTRARLLDPQDAIDQLRAHLHGIRAVGPSIEADRLSSPRSRPQPVGPVVDLSGRPTPAKRLRIISIALAMGEAADGPVTFEHLAEVGGVKPTVALQAVKQYAYAEYQLFEGDQSLDHGVVANGLVISDDEQSFTVDEPWWLDKWQPSPAQALRLWVAATIALSLSAQAEPSVHQDNLRQACHKLSQYLHATPTVVESPPPPKVAQLRRLASDGTTVWLSYLSGASTLPREAVEVDVLRIVRDRDRWVVEARVRCVAPDTTSLSLGPPRDAAHELDQSTMTRFDLDRIVAFCMGDRASERIGGWTLSERPESRPVQVVLHLKRSALWLCDAYEVTRLTQLDDRRVRIELTLPGMADLRTILLWLGPQGRLVEPARLRDLQMRLAMQVLDLYP